MRLPCFAKEWHGFFGVHPQTICCVPQFAKNVDLAQNEHYQNTKGDTTMESILYVGMDVHKDTNSVCAYDAKNDKYLSSKRLPSPTNCVIFEYFVIK